MPYSATIGTDPPLKSPSTRVCPQRFSSTEFWRRLRAAKTLKSLAAQHGSHLLREAKFEEKP
jgi:hypothetical protein